MNDRFDLRIITQPHSQVYWGYFRRLVFGNSSTKHNKLTYFSNSMLFCSDVLLPFSHIPRCIHAKTPDFPRLFEPRDKDIAKLLLLVLLMAAFTVRHILTWHLPCVRGSNKENRCGSFMSLRSNISLLHEEANCSSHSYWYKWESTLLVETLWCES